MKPVTRHALALSALHGGHRRRHGRSQGVDTTPDGTVIVEGDDACTTLTSTSSYNYYREIISAANTIGINFNVTSWY